MLLRKIDNRQTRRGFTLMEVIVVAAIIVILAGTGTVVYMRFVEDAKKDEARMGAHQISTAIQKWQLTYGSEPTMDELVNPRGNEKALLERKLSVDPWGQAWHIDVSGNTHHEGQKPDVWAVSPDGIECGNW
jgi:prepilin-type N-terminal cleavage/methylation domain-containing protein